MEDDVKNILVDIQTTVSSLVKCENDYAQKQGTKMQKYLSQLQKGEISQDEFCASAKDLADLAIMELDKIEVIGKVEVQKIFDKIKTLLYKIA